MSHIVTIKTEVRDAGAAMAAAKSLGLDEPFHGTVRLFDGEASGLLVNLPGWLYPVVLDTTIGQVRYDNYNGSWGDQSPAQVYRVTPFHAALRADRRAALNPLRGPRPIPEVCAS